MNPPEKEKVSKKSEEDTQSFSKVLNVDNTAGIITETYSKAFPL